MGGGGGATGGTWSWDPGPPPWVKRVHIQEKSSSGPRSKCTHSGHNTQRSFDPPPQKGYPGAGGGGVQGSKSKKTIGGSFLILK